MLQDSDCGLNVVASSQRQTVSLLMHMLMILLISGIVIQYDMYQTATRMCMLDCSTNDDTRLLAVCTARAAANMAMLSTWRLHLRHEQYIWSSATHLVLLVLEKVLQHCGSWTLKWSTIDSTTVQVLLLVGVDGWLGQA